MSAILVTGATGFIGSRVCDSLIEKGEEVVVVSRNPARAQTSLSAVKDVYGWNAETDFIPSEATSDIRAVVHLAGETIAGRWNEKKKQRIRDSRILSTRCLVESLRNAQNRAAVLVCASAIGYYGESGDAQFTETSPPGTDFLANVCQEWEAEAQKATALGIRVVMVRIGLVLGVGGGLLKQVLPPFKMGVGGKLGSGNQWMSWVQVDDVVGIIMHALENTELSGPLNATAPTPVRNTEFTKTLGSVIARPTLFPVPLVVLKGMMGEFADFIMLSQRVIPEKTEQSGYQFQYRTLEPALKACLKKREA